MNFPGLSLIHIQKLFYIFLNITTEILISGYSRIFNEYSRNIFVDILGISIYIRYSKNIPQIPENMVEYFKYILNLPGEYF